MILPYMTLPIKPLVNLTIVIYLIGFKAPYYKHVSGCEKTQYSWTYESLLSCLCLDELFK